MCIFSLWCLMTSFRCCTFPINLGQLAKLISGVSVIWLCQNGFQPGPWIVFHPWSSSIGLQDGQNPLSETHQLWLLCWKIHSVLFSVWGCEAVLLMVNSCPDKHQKHILESINLIKMHSVSFLSSDNLRDFKILSPFFWSLSLSSFLCVCFILPSLHTSHQIGVAFTLVRSWMTNMAGYNRRHGLFIF